MNPYTSILFFTLSLFAQFAYANCYTQDSPLADKIANRQSCIVVSNFLQSEPQLNSTTINQILRPTLNQQTIKNNDIVYCRYHYQEQNGNSAKFRCLQTNSKNELIDSKGNLAASAVSTVSEDGEIYLLDSTGNKLKDSNGKFRKAKKLKVRYTDGKKRNRENFTSSAASRLLIAMGIPAHTNIMTEKVLCFGCEANPFPKQKTLSTKTSYSTFQFASIEDKFKADRLYEPEDKPWSWKDLSQLNAQLTPQQRIDIEVLLLANHFLGYTSDGSGQNAIVCNVFDIHTPSRCNNVISMVHDIGASFGIRYGPSITDRPRGDIKAYEKSLIFQPGTCIFKYATKDGKSLPKTISREAQINFLNRAKILDQQFLVDVFRTSNMGYLETDGTQTEVEKRLNRWANAVTAKLEEIEGAPCQ